MPLDWPIKLESIQTNLQNPLTNEVVNDDDDDECSVFGKYLVKKLRGYDRKVKCIVQYNINKMLFQADMGCYNDGRYSSNELSELANIQ